MAVKDTPNKNFTIYLSFKNKATAEKWLAAHGISTKFSRSQMISVKVLSEDANNAGRKN